MLISVTDSWNESSYQPIKDILFGGNNMNSSINDYCKLDDGLYCNDKFLAAFIPTLDAIVIKKDVTNGTEIRKYLISVTLPDGRKLTGHEFDSVKNIPYFQVWKECCDAGLSSKQVKLLNLYLQQQASTAEIKMTYYFSRTGYYQNAFVFGANKIINLASEQGCHYETGNDLPAFGLVEADRKSYISYICRLLRTKKGVTEILLLCSLLSIVKPLFCKLGYLINFFPVIYGKSGVGKSILARLFFVLNPEQEKNFKLDNTVSIGKTLERFSGHTVLIDDYHPETLPYGKQRQDSILDFVARIGEDATSALAVITAEFRGGCFSVQDRMVQIEVRDKITDFNNIKYLQENHNTYCSFLYDFAEQIYQKTDYVKFAITECFAKDQCNSKSRISYNVQLLRACAIIFYEMYLGESDRTRLNEELCVDNFETYVFQLLDEIEKKQTRYMTRVMQSEGEVDWIEILYKILYIEDIVEVYPDLKSLNNAEHRELGVVLEKDQYFIRSHTLKKALQEYFCQKINPKQMIEALLFEHILDEDKSSSHMKKKKMVTTIM